MAVISAEGGLWGVLSGRYSEVPNLDPFLKGHAGDSCRVDRKGRPAELIDRPALTIVQAVQPGVLEATVRNRRFRETGMLARFLYSLPESNLGRREIGAPSVPAEVAADYAAHVKKLAEEMHGWQDPAILRLDADASKFLVGLEREVEPRLGPDGSLAPIVEWASKWVGAIIRIAGLLHLA